MLVLCFVPVPFSVEMPDYDVDFVIVRDEGNFTEIPRFDVQTSSAAWTNVTEDLMLVNNGNVEATVLLGALSSNESLCQLLLFNDTESVNLSSEKRVDLPLLGSENLTLRISALPGASGNVTISVHARYYYDGQDVSDDLNLNDEVRIYIAFKP